MFENYSVGGVNFFSDHITKGNLTQATATGVGEDEANEAGGTGESGNAAVYSANAAKFRNVQIVSIDIIPLAKPPEPEVIIPPERIDRPLSKKTKENQEKRKNTRREIEIKY